MGIHIMGHKPEKLLNSYRPNEPKDVHNYRLDIYEPITKGEAKRIINTIGKIQSESNYSVSFPIAPTAIQQDEDIETYCRINYPYFQDVHIWAFDVALKQALIDPNSLAVFMPTDEDISDNEFYKPFGKIYPCHNLIDYSLDLYYTLLLDEKSLIKKSGQESYTGLIYIIVTSTQIIKVIQVGEERDKKIFKTEILFNHNFGECPVFFLKGDYIQNTFPPCWESYISGVLPFWNKAVRLDSDLDANYVQHLYLERVEIQVECDGGCRFDETQKNYVTQLQNGDCVTCARCGGSGFITGRSPYGVTSVKKDNISNVPLEFPGVEYINKPTNIVELAEKKVKELIEKGLASINMDVLNDIVADQSGIAKTIDRDDLNSFLSKIADNMFDNILKNSYRYINLWRYNLLFNGNKEKLAANLPIINKPTAFDVTTASMITAEMQAAKASGVSNETISEMELDVIDKKFPNDKERRNLSRAYIELDPLSGLTETEKSEMAMTGGTTKENLIISIHIKHFILNAIEENPNFLLLSRKEKIEKLTEMARIMITSPISGAEQGE
ncbi:MAG: hypothetical protein O8C60_02590 [Candidatus Methanoperedens sp.]|nr:hypothetical protein [Candidatus Methanoperedens sp.]